jgi:hypothetical protein
MQLDEARELRRELERIEAAMRRIKDLWEKLPSADDLDGLGDVVCEIASAMDDILEKAAQLPKPDAVAFGKGRPQ